MKFKFPMPKNYPQSFKRVRKELSRILDKMTEYREKHPKALDGFFDEFEEMYLDSLNKKGEEQVIRQLTLYLTWCQFMAIIKEELKENE